MMLTIVTRLVVVKVYKNVSVKSCKVFFTYRQVVQMNRFHENGQHLVGQQLTAFDHVEGTLCQRTLGLDYFSLAARS